MNRFRTRRWTKKELVAYRLGKAQLATKYKLPRVLKGSKTRFCLRSGNREEIREFLFNRDGSLCCWCGLEMAFGGNPNCDRFATIEHVVRRADGGSNNVDNLKLACRRCNNERHSKTTPCLLNATTPP